jgi:hypothetical protein
MVELLSPRRGGFLRPFGCGWFIREYLSGNGPEGSPRTNPVTGAPQSDIFYHYKMALIEVTARDRAVRHEEKAARKENRPINPDEIEELTGQYMGRLPYKSKGCRYHSFVIYFSNLKRLGWVEHSGHQEHSAFQGNYPPGPPRIFYRLTDVGRTASDAAWANPHAALYGK